MPAFKDANGQDWQLRVTVGHLRPLREKFGVDLKAALTKDGIAGLGDVIGDPERLYDLLLMLCEPQLKERSIDPLAFANLLDAATLRDAVPVLVEAILDFSQGPKAALEIANGLRSAMTTRDDRATSLIAKHLPDSISRVLAGSSPALRV